MPIACLRNSLKTAIGLALLVLVGSGTGCHSLRSFRQGDSLAKAPCQLPEEPTVGDLVTHLNQNVDRLHSWRATRMKISANGLPLSGDLAVQHGRELRLVVNSMAGTEVDIGSNQELFWLWSKRLDPPYIVCRHEDVSMAREQLGVPFEPDWLRQVLGVEPLAVEGTRLQFDKARRRAVLTTLVATEAGQPVKRVVVMETCQGRVLEHVLYDVNEQVVAKAMLSDHRREEKTGVIVPHHIVLEVPQAQMRLAMTIPEIEANPNGLPAQMWTMPKPPGVQPLDLGLAMRQHQHQRGSADSLEPAFGKAAVEPVGRVTFGNDNDEEAAAEANSGNWFQPESGDAPTYEPSRAEVAPF